MNKLLMTVASLAVAAAPLAAFAQSSGHDHGGWNNHGSNAERTARGGDRGSYGRGNEYARGDYRRGDDRDGGGALAAGLAGLFLGSALASSQSYGYSQPYSYAQPYAYDESYGRGCWRNQAFEGRYGDVEYRQVNVCR